MHGLILSQIHQNFNIMDLLIFMETMLTGLFSKILLFTNLMIIPTMKIATSQIDSFVHHSDTIQDHDSHLLPSGLFKYQNVISNLKNVNTIHSSPYWVGYRMASLNGHFWTPHSMPVCQWVPFSKIITNHIFLKWICIFMTSLLQLIPYNMTHLALMMVIHVPSYLLAKSHWFWVYMILKHIAVFQYIGGKNLCMRINA